MHVHVYVYVYVRMYVCVFVCVYVCMCVYLCVCVFDQSHRGALKAFIHTIVTTSKPRLTPLISDGCHATMKRHNYLY